MSPLLNLGRRKNRSLSEVLSTYLSRTREGKNIIRAFEKNPSSASPAIVDYVDRHLKDQPEFQQQLREVLGKEASERFSTVVAGGGHVDQIINAELVEQLEIRYYIFQDSRQVITFLLGVVVIGTAIASLYWWSVQPRWMNGDFNIAVAQFSAVGDVDPNVAKSLSSQVFRFLNGEANKITFERIEVSDRNIGQIRSAQEARTLAKRINAQVVIYGDVTAVGEQVQLIPQFYVAEAFRSDASELNGQQKLEAPITLPKGGPDPVSLELLRGRAVIMTQFTKALVYLAAEDLTRAKESISQAVQHSERQSPFAGQEVLYLFASHIARLQKDETSAQAFVDHALRLNPLYGRGYIAKANIYYDEGNLFQAIENYKLAADQPDQPFGAYVREKANLGIGNSCLLQYEGVLANREPDPVALAALKRCAFDHYQRVVDFYEQQKDPETNLTEMAAGAYYGLGRLLGEPFEAAGRRSMFERALQLTTDDDLKESIRADLKEVKE